MVSQPRDLFEPTGVDKPANLGDPKVPYFVDKMKRGSTLFKFAFVKKKKQSDENAEETTHTHEEDNLPTATSCTVGKDSVRPTSVCEISAVSASDDNQTPSSSKPAPQEEKENGLPRGMEAKVAVDRRFTGRHQMYALHETSQAKQSD